ncbi:MAG: LPS export ABC transporter periplasmic protein LptC [Magnetococcus sp. WYHC-3]
MRQAVKLGLLLLTLALPVSGMLLLSPPPPTPATPEEHTTLPDQLDSQATQLELEQFDQGHTVWTLKAQSALRPRSGHAVAEEPHLILQTPRQGTVQVRAMRALVDLESRQMTFSGNVRMEDTREHALTTTRMEFNPHGEILSSDQPFEFTSPGETLRGVGFQFDHKAQKLQVLNHVRLVFHEGIADAP